MGHPDPLNERGYDEVRLGQWRAGRMAGGGFTRRDLARLAAGLSLATAGSALTAAPAYADPVQSDPVLSPIVKPLPPEVFTVYGSNAEMRWEAMAGQGYLVPVDRFFVRD